MERRGVGYGGRGGGRCVSYSYNMVARDLDLWSITT